MCSGCRSPLNLPAGVIQIWSGDPGSRALTLPPEAVISPRAYSMAVTRTSRRVVSLTAG